MAGAGISWFVLGVVGPGFVDGFGLEGEVVAAAARAVGCLVQQLGPVSRPTGALGLL